MAAGEAAAGPAEPAAVGHVGALAREVRCAPLHANGECDVLHAGADGGGVLTIGADGRLICTDPSGGEGQTGKAWTHRLSRDAPTAGAVSPDLKWLAVGMEIEMSHGAWLFQLDGKDGRPGIKTQVVARFTLPVRHLGWHPTRPLLGIATDDGKICTWDREGGGRGGASQRPRRQDFAGHSGGARCLAFDPRGELLAAAFCGGALAVYGLDGAELFRANVWPKAVIATERLLIAWRPDGGALALPGGSAVRVVARGDYKADLAVLENGHGHPTTVAAWAAGGELLATASHDAVALWRPADAQLLHICRPDAEACSLLWSDRVLVLGTRSGSWARVEAPEAPGAAPATTAPAAEPAAADASTGDATTQHAGTTAAEAPASVAAGSAAPRLGQPAFQPGATSDPRRRYLAWNEHGMLKLVVSGGADAGQAGRRGARAPAPATAKVEVDYAREHGRAALREREWEIGPGLRMGALGPGVCALAFEGSAGEPPGVDVRAACAAGDRSQFWHGLPGGEVVEALAVGSGFVAALTSPHNFLRIFSAAGTPFAVLSAHGEAVCLAACEDLLLCVTRAPGTLRAEPALEFALYRVSGRECLAAGQLPLSPGCNLRWAGFSAEAMALTLDSGGVLRGLALSGGPPLLAEGVGDWLPLAELEGGGKLLWPVRAEGCILYCAEVPKEGDEPKMGAARRLREAPWRLPLGRDAEGPQKVLRSRLVSAHQEFALEMGMLPTPARRAARGETAGKVGSAPLAERAGRQAVKLFEALCKNGEVERALDAALCYFGVEDPPAPRALRLLEEAQAAAGAQNEATLAARVAALAGAAAPGGEARAGAASREMEAAPEEDESQGMEAAPDEGMEAAPDEDERDAAAHEEPAATQRAEAGQLADSPSRAAAAGGPAAAALAAADAGSGAGAPSPAAEGGFLFPLEPAASQRTEAGPLAGSPPRAAGSVVGVPSLATEGAGAAAPEGRGGAAGLTAEQLAEIQRKRAAAQERKAARQRALAAEAVSEAPPATRPRLA